MTTLEPLGQVDLPDGRCIALARGDLGALTEADGIDALVLSAFPDHYEPTPWSVIGALQRRGLSVADLATHKAADLRATTACWVSEVIPDGPEAVGFRLLVCFEPTEPTGAAERVGDVFRALVPLVGGPDGIRSVALPVLATGDQAQSARDMVPAICEAGRTWMRTGLPLERLVLVVRSSPEDEAAVEAFTEWFLDIRDDGVGPQGTTERARPAYDLFVSYARVDGKAGARGLVDALTETDPDLRTFLDLQAIRPGAFWQQEVYDCLNSCRMIVALLTPGFLTSKVCQEELNIAMVRNRTATEPVLIPLYLLSAPLPPHIEALNHIDCRELDPGRIREAGEAIRRSLSGG